jgi:hypothetical protein
MRSRGAYPGGREVADGAFGPGTKGHPGGCHSLWYPPEAIGRQVEHLDQQWAGGPGGGFFGKLIARFKLERGR